MSNYRDNAFHPVRKKIEDATWVDDYFGRHQYGVRFDREPRVYRPEEVRIPEKLKAPPLTERQKP